MVKFVTLVPLFPLLGFLINALFGKKIGKGLVATIGWGSVLISFVLSILIFLDINAQSQKAFTYELFDWITAGKLKIAFSFLIDPLSSLFLLIITGIGFLIHVYSAGYMHDDEAYHKFFSYLNLFVFFMLLLVLGANFPVMFIGWEGVGLCSYLLIGFWFKNGNYNLAAKKAFVMNRIGDLGFLLGMYLIFTTFGTLDFYGEGGVFTQARTMATNENVLLGITLLLFVGATGKSAQIPLYTWLPDAMAGPTPVSALIHAATMVTAGIYMIARSNILFTLAPDTLHIIALVGVITALFAASIGLVQNDIKKVLAYSTVSQLGLMFLALGMGAYVTAVFHVMTHAFFKALLFLGAGSVIHAMSGEQDIRSMGGLKKSLPITFLTFLIATLAISGIPPFSGFFSKDEILAHAFAHNKIFWLLGLAASAMTTYYMFRLLFLTFYGEFRGTEKQKHHLHESPSNMTVPLMVLAVLSTIGGFIGVPEALHGTHLLKGFLDPVMADSAMRMLPAELDHFTEYALMGVTLLTILIMFLYARNKFITKKEVSVADDAPVSKIHRTLLNKYYVDEIYQTMLVGPVKWLGVKFKDVIEKYIIDGAVNLSGRVVVLSSQYIRYIQTGNVGVYLFAMVAGMIALLLYLRFF
jgi:NADH-quinone oxidoreductase subunit L